MPCKAADKGAGLAGQGAGGEGFGKGRGHVRRAKRIQQSEAALVLMRVEREFSRRIKQLYQVMQAAQMAERVQKGGQQDGVVLPVATLMQGDAALTGALTVEPHAAGKPALVQRVMDAAAMASQMRTGGTRRFVDGEILARIKSQPDTAKRRAGGAIGGQGGQVSHAQTCASSFRRGLWR